VNAAADTVTEAEAFVEAFGEYWALGGPAEAFVARFTPLLRPDVRLVQPQLPPVTGREAFRTQFAEPLFALIPDARGEVLGWAERDGKVYIELEIRGHVGRRPVVVPTCDRVTLVEGQVAERVAHLDPTPLLKAIATSPRTWRTFVRAQLRGRR
jgi:hypothetical protein